MTSVPSRLIQSNDWRDPFRSLLEYDRSLPREDAKSLCNPFLAYQGGIHLAQPWCARSKCYFACSDEPPMVHWEGTMSSFRRRALKRGASAPSLHSATDRIAWSRVESMDELLLGRGVLVQHMPCVHSCLDGSLYNAPLCIARSFLTEGHSVLCLFQGIRSAFFSSAASVP